MGGGIRVLYVDDEPDLLHITRIFLEKSGQIRVDISTSAQEALVSYQIASYDAIISDYQMPDMDGITFLKIIRENYGDIPFVLFTGRGREEVVIEAINNGADFYLQKGGDPKAQFAELAHQVRQAVRRKQAEVILAEREQRIFDLQNATDLIQSLSPDGHFLYVNKKWLDTLGYTEQDLLDLTIFDVIHVDSIAHCTDTFRRITSGENVGIIDAVFRTRDGVPVFVEGISDCKIIQGKCLYTREIFKDVTHRKRAEQELMRKSEELSAAFEEITAAEEELRHNYDTLACKEQALQEINDTFRAVVEQSNEGIIIVDFTGRLLFANRRAANIVGSNGDLDTDSNLNVLEFVLPDSRANALRDFEEVARGHDRFLVSYKIQTLTGQEKWIECIGKRISVRESPVLLLSFWDVIDNRLAETSVRESEKRFRSIVETSMDIIWEIDLQGTLRYVSPNVEKNLGYQPEELVGKPAHFLAPDDKRSGLLQDLERYIKMRGPLPLLEVPLLHRDGHSVVLEIRPSPMTGEDGTLIGFLGVAIDITERKRAQEALRDSEEKFRTLVEYSLDGILILDPQGKVLFANPAAGQIIEDENYLQMVGKSNVMQFIAPESREDVLRGFQEVANGIDGYIARYKIVTAKKAEHWVEVIGKSIVFDGAPSILISLRDITDRRRSEEELRQANNKLNLLSNITRHDINNQLLTLNSYLTLIQQKVSNPSLDEYFSQVLSASRQISAMIRFAKEYEHVGMYAPVWHGIRSLVNNVGKESRPGTYMLQNHLPSDMQVLADPLINKVFFNLIDNAIRHGGPMTTIRFSLESSNGDSIIVCEDDGDGIDPACKEKIFCRGFGKNTGYGLSISRDILGITGITIKETGVAGRGARFEISIPEGYYRFSAQ